MKITYVSPASDRPIGGIKVFYRHAEMLSASGVESYVFHPGNPGFSCTWFAHSAKLRDGRRFDANSDFVVIPEIWAAELGKVCAAERIKYGIFVQNGYLISHLTAGSSEQDLRAAYEGASLIASISSDTTEVIRMTYPRLPPERIVRVLPSVGEGFRPATKTRTLAFMPRKLPEHANKVCFHLRQCLPGGWTLLPIDNFNEAQVAKALGQSAIFLSFCDQEGCPLPPLEAAFSGNIVVGYTGQGGKEYFRRPIFREVHNGDFVGYVASVRQAIADVEGGALDSAPLRRQLADLEAEYSRTNERQHLLEFASRVQPLYP